ncbi:ATP-binding protein [Sphingopyxis sp. KK2]|uniref:ATP-binding protein n=1 Tax=Sphingopyxis sp. KK2 TaxID=1855727 RepID=UPI00097E613E|nr:ATP-binding protein [Sphingopyxis sp. KK2]
MFDRLSSLVVALTLVAIAAILAALAGGDALAIAILAAAGVAAAAIVYSALPGTVIVENRAEAAPTPALPPISLLRHPDFALWADQEKEPLLGCDGNIVTLANDAAIRLLGRHIVGADVRTAIRHPAATEWLSNADAAAMLEPINLIDFPRPGQRWTMRIASLSGGQRILFLADRSAIDAADRMRSDFVANASHELRTPLAAILGYVETLQDMNEADSATRHRFLSIIEREARRMQQLVIDLLSISRVEADRFRRPTAQVDLTAIVRATIAQLKDSENPRAKDVVAAFDDAPLSMLGDEAQLGQLVHNIIFNAMKYGRADTPVTVELLREGPRARLSVRDEGEGIAPDHLPRLTERFYRVDEARSRSVGGTGLGLAIVKHISERHQGQLDIESEVGKGTRVSVAFPLNG